MKMEDILQKLSTQFNEGVSFSAAEAGYNWRILNKLVGNNSLHKSKNKIKGSYRYYFGELKETPPISADNINHNDKIYSLEEIKNMLRWTNYKNSSLFQHLGKLTKDIEHEKINLIIDDNKTDQTGLVYAFVIDNHIFKLGKTDNTMTDRIQSYNCGKQKHRENGTCSTTNYMVLQTFLNLPIDIDVYIYKVPQATLSVFGEEVLINTSPSKYVENKLIEDLIEQSNGIKPIGLVQK